MSSVNLCFRILLKERSIKIYPAAGNVRNVIKEKVQHQRYKKMFFILLSEIFCLFFFFPTQVSTSAASSLEMMITVSSFTSVLQHWGKWRVGCLNIKAFLSRKDQHWWRGKAWKTHWNTCQTHSTPALTETATAASAKPQKSERAGAQTQEEGESDSL